MISVIITLLNDWRVKDTLDTILNQTILPDEIIVADGGSKKDLLDYLNNYSKENEIVKIYDIPGSIAESRNRTIPLAKGDIIIFLDSDETAPKDWLEKLVYPILKGEADFVGGTNIGMHKPKNNIEKYVYKSADINYKNVCIDDPSMIPMGNSAWKKEIFDVIGNFDKKLKWGGEDYDINIRAIQAGFKGVFSLDAWVWHDRGMDTIKKFILKNYRYNIGTTVAYLKNNELKSKKKGAIKLIYIHPLEFFKLFIKVFSFIRGNIMWKKLYKES
jgi:glycosyltransferase involved in cell wall biosynthesis